MGQLKKGQRARLCRACTYMYNYVKKLQGPSLITQRFVAYRRKNLKEKKLITVRAVHALGSK